MRVLQLTAHFSPNIGGVETHLTDLVDTLTKRGWGVFVLTYKPLTTKASSKIYEEHGLSTIIRIPWLSGLFYQLVKHPLLEFLYLLPGLFFTAPLVLFLVNPNIIHAHGLVAGFVAVFWGKIFRKKVVISLHSIYSFPNVGIYTNFVTAILKNADYILGLSRQSTEEIESLGIEETKVKKFTYWIDLKKFRKIGNAKFKLDWEEKFTCLFVGRLVHEKGVEELLESVKSWDQDINLKIVGSGPMEKKIEEVASNLPNLDFIKGVDPDNLPLYYSGSDLLIVPSVSEEGFGRVILEALACGLPVIGSNRGAIGEAMDNTVGKLINVTPQSIKSTVEYFYQHQNRLKKLTKNCRNFAERRYSEKNAEEIISSFKE